MHTHTDDEQKQTDDDGDVAAGRRNMKQIHCRFFFCDSCLTSQNANGMAVGENVPMAKGQGHLSCFGVAYGGADSPNWTALFHCRACHEPEKEG